VRVALAGAGAFAELVDAVLATVDAQDVVGR
jgi:hypothetical protein